MTKNNNTRILVIDDDPDIRKLLCTFLEKQGYKVTSGGSAREGLSLFAKDEFSMVILDMNLPDQNGIEIMKSILDIDRNAVVLIITGFATIEASVEAMKSGAYDFIPKPIKLDALDLIISRAVEKSSLFRQLSVFKGLALALMISVPIWLVLGIILAKIII